MKNPIVKLHERHAELGQIRATINQLIDAVNELDARINYKKPEVLDNGKESADIDNGAKGQGKDKRKNK